MADPVQFMLDDLISRHAQMPALSHERLNGHFDATNGRAKSEKKNYWAESSRQMLALIDELDETLDCLRLAGFEVAFADEYRGAIDRCKPWLSMSWGSTVPDDFELIKLIKHRPAFIRPEIAVRLKKRESSVQFEDGRRRVVCDCVLLR